VGSPVSWQPDRAGPHRRQPALKSFQQFAVEHCASDLQEDEHLYYSEIGTDPTVLNGSKRQAAKHSPRPIEELFEHIEKLYELGVYRETACAELAQT
jgi:hypothetical protein